MNFLRSIFEGFLEAIYFICLLTVYVLIWTGTFCIECAISVLFIRLGFIALFYYWDIIYFLPSWQLLGSIVFVIQLFKTDYISFLNGIKQIRYAQLHPEEFIENG